MNSNVQKLIDEYGPEAHALAEKIDSRYRDAAHWGDGHQAAYEDTLRDIGEAIKKERKAAFGHKVAETTGRLLNKMLNDKIFIPGPNFKENIRILDKDVGDA